MPARTTGSRYASGRRQNAPKKPSVQSCGTGTGVTAASGPISLVTVSSGGHRAMSHLMASSGRYSRESQNDRAMLGSHVRTTIRPATRRISAKPLARSGQWWIVRTASAASTAPSQKRDRLGRRRHRRGEARPPLSDHHLRGINRQHRLARLVRA